MITYYQADAPTILAQHQPALLLDYAQGSEFSAAALLRDSGLSLDDISKPEARISTLQYAQMLKNLLKGVPADDTSFMLGQQMLPGHFGDLSHALMQAQNLRQALQILVQHHSRLCPLLCPRINEGGGLTVLYWMDSCGAPALRSALVEMHMTAVVAMCRWLSGERLAWRFCFNRSSARHTEQHEVHLGPELRFNCHLDAMIIDSASMDKPWPRGNASAANAALGRAEQTQTQQPQGVSLLDALYNYLLEQCRCTPTLEATSAAFGVSPATMKRYLARHGTHFQAELDQVRTHVALYLFQTLRYDNEAVAKHLGFHDANNFRRSFKRWTGLTPSLLRAGLMKDFLGLNLSL